MFEVTHASHAGYRHVQSNLPCQDTSLADSSSQYAIVITADGHGGSLYFRSKKGSELAIQVIYEMFIDLSYLGRNDSWELENFHRFKLNLLSRWNHLVEQDFLTNPFLESELTEFSEEKRHLLKTDFYHAYGTTLNATLWTTSFILSIQIGDGSIVLIDHNLKSHLLFENIEEDTAANYTHSLCESTAYDHIHFQLTPINEVLAIVHTTDGFVIPFVTLNNYFNQLEKNIVPYLIDHSPVENTFFINEITKDMAEKLGLGDDVSMAIAIKKPILQKD